MHEKQLLFARKGDGGFNWGSACASKGDGGFNPTHRRASKGDRGFTREISDVRGLWRGLAAVPVGGGGACLRKVACNSIGRSFNKVRKRCNSNDLNSRFERIVGELHAELGVGSAMMWIVISTPGATGVEGAGGSCRGAGGRWRSLARLRDDAPSYTAPPVWRAPEGAAAVPVGGGRAWPGFETTRRAEGSQRGRRAGGPPPTGTHSGRALRCPEHQRRHKHHHKRHRKEKPQNSS